ncbi:MAG: transposase [Nitrospirae bacterium]|nr:transposase [Nitrospirota bacterium]
MKYTPEIHHRRSIRLKDYDYSQAGAYFVTICTKDKECLLGAVAGGKMHLNDYGKIAMKCWDDLPNHYSHIESDEFVIMPNHMHGVIVINNVGAGLKPAQIISEKMDTSRAGFKPAPTPKQHGLSEIIRAFKTFSSRRINEMRNTSGIPVWQRNYYEHIIRSEIELNKIREYIINNSLNWKADENYKD